MDYRRIYAIPDIHGRLDMLEDGLELMAKDGYDSQKDLLVFTGDLIDRGPDSKGVVDLVMDLIKKNPKNVKMVRGNHEDFPINLYIKNLKYATEAWIYNGMWSTIQSYESTRMSDEHVNFLANQPYSLEVQGFFFSHAPVPHRKNAGMCYTPQELTWTYFHYNQEPEIMNNHPGPLSSSGEGSDHLVGVCGHLHRGPKVKNVRIYPKYRLLDCGAGCFEEGRLAIHECISSRTLYVDPLNR